MNGIDPPWRTDPFQNIIAVHWEDEPASGPDRTRLAGSVGGSVSGAWDHFSKSGEPVFPGPEWHSTPQPMPPYTLTAATGVGGGCRIRTPGSEWTTSWGGIPGTETGLATQTVSLEKWFSSSGETPNDWCIIAGLGGVVANLTGMVATVTASACQVSGTWAWIQSFPLLGAVQATGSPVELINVTFDYSTLTLGQIDLPGAVWHAIRMEDVVHGPNGITFTVVFER